MKPDIRFWPYNEPDEPEKLPRRARRTARLNFVFGTVLGFGALGTLTPARAAVEKSPDTPTYLGTRTIDGLTYKVLEDADKTIHLEPNDTALSALKDERGKAPRIFSATYSSTRTGIQEQVQVLTPGTACSIIEYDYSAQLTNQGKLLEKNLAAYYATADAGIITSERTAGNVRAIGRHVLGQVAMIGDVILHGEPKKEHPKWRVLKDVAMIPVNIIGLPYRAIHYARKGSILNTLRVPNLNNSDNVIVEHYNNQNDLNRLIAMALNHSPPPRPPSEPVPGGAKPPLPETPVVLAGLSFTPDAEIPALPLADFPVPARSYDIDHYPHRAHRDAKPTPQPEALKNPVLAQSSPATPVPAAQGETGQQKPERHQSSLPLSATLATLFGLGAFAAGRRMSFQPQPILAIAAAGGPPASPYSASVETGTSRATANTRAPFSLPESLRNLTVNAFKHAPSALVSTATGMGARAVIAKGAIALTAKFGLAAAIATLPAVAMPALAVTGTILGAAALGAATSSAACFVAAAVFDKKKEAGWAKRALRKGLVGGAITGLGFGALGATVAHFIPSDGLMHGVQRLWDHVTHQTTSANVSHIASSVPGHATTTMPLPSGNAAPVHVVAPAPHAITPAPTHAATPVPHPSDVARHNVEAFRMMEKEIKLHPDDQLAHANLAYAYRWGIGTAKNLIKAHYHAGLGGHAAHDYGQKLLQYDHVAAIPAPAPA